MAMHRALLASFALVLGTVWGPAVASAQDASADNSAKAQELYNAGLRAYNVGEFDQAIKDWKAAYQFLGVPDFLFNIAQAYRQKQDFAEAVFFYNAYLRGKPDAANVAEVTALRDEMAALLEAQRTTEAMPPDPDVVADPATSTGAAPPEIVESRTQDSSAGKGLRVGGLVAGATGIAFVATGVAFALSASSTESDLEAAATNLEVWSDEYADREASAERSATIGTVLVATGAAAIVGGGVLYYLGYKKRKESSGMASLTLRPTLEPQRSGAGVSLGWSF